MPLQFQVPSPARLLRAWETALETPPAQQALLVLAACCPDASAGALAALPLGARNHLLITAHLAMFTPVYDCVADCSGCGCLLETQLPLPQVAGLESAPLAAPAAAEADLVAAGLRMRYRLPTAGDLAAVATQLQGHAAPERPGPQEDAVAALLRRCLLEADGDPADLPSEATEALAEALTADPDAVLSVQLTCPECGASSDLVLDPVTFLWADLDDWAWRLLGEVHELASGYGWDEDTILAISPGRRSAYLSLLAADDRAEPVGERR